MERQVALFAGGVLLSFALIGLLLDLAEHIKKRRDEDGGD